MEPTDVLFFIGFAVGLFLVLIFGWLLTITITITAAIAMYRNENVREAIQPLLDEF